MGIPGKSWLCLSLVLGAGGLAADGAARMQLFLVLTSGPVAEAAAPAVTVIRTGALGPTDREDLA